MNTESSTEELLNDINNLRSESYHGLLSTHSVKYQGYPFGSLLPFCRDSKGNLMLLISHLAQHTRNLEHDPRCSLTMTGQGDGDVQQLARLTCLAQAEAVNSTAAAERYFRFYPEARRYRKELNFRFYRLDVKHYYYIGGFGSARWFDPSRIPPPIPFSTADEAELLYQLNAHNHDLLKQLLDSNGIPADTSVEVVGLDPYGLDIRLATGLRRLQFKTSCEDKSAFLNHVFARSNASASDTS
ncbi:MAG: pyridoxamine 5'-phosphate oxidase family protein [Candidatus Thiodiazotropha sp. (ex Cardiolucina cf. quadrata)]|nr:pyridoxamine 5'-phosphate oxidase family protein [Candidatus Thiodiazotropha sp. (ex Cardiolucina cf. quadrata)]